MYGRVTNDKVFDVLVNVSVRLVNVKAFVWKIKYILDLFTYSLPLSRYGRLFWPRKELSLIELNLKSVGYCERKAPKRK